MLRVELHLKFRSHILEIPYGLVVRIAGFHPAVPCSTPGMGRLIWSHSGCHFKGENDISLKIFLKILSNQ